MIKITYTSTHMLYFYTWKIASTSPIHPQIKLQDVPCLSLSKVIIIMYGLYKRNKRCIPKEGMPHAHKACQKREREREKVHTQRRYATYTQGVTKKKKKEKKEREREKRCIPKEGMPHTHKACQKKRKRKKKKEKI